MSGDDRGRDGEVAAARDGAETIAAYLAAHPSFLRDRPELFATLAPPARVHGEVLADHLQAMVFAARRRADAAEAQSRAVLETQRALAAIGERVQRAALAAIASDNLAECVTHEFPHLLGVDAACLACESFRPHWRILPPGAIQRLTQGRDVLVRNRPADAMLLHAEAALLAERDILVRLDGSRPALLALVSRDAGFVPHVQGAGAFAFLGRVLAALTER